VPLQQTKKIKRAVGGKVRMIKTKKHPKWKNIAMLTAHAKRSAVPKVPESGKNLRGSYTPKTVNKGKGGFEPRKRESERADGDDPRLGHSREKKKKRTSLVGGAAENEKTFS